MKFKHLLKLLKLLKVLKLSIGIRNFQNFHYFHYFYYLYNLYISTPPKSYLLTMAKETVINVDNDLDGDKTLQESTKPLISCGLISAKCNL